MRIKTTQGLQTLREATVCEAGKELSPTANPMAGNPSTGDRKAA